jgi:hypothetical protein
MGLLEWLKGGGPPSPEPAGMSRRDFFTRVARPAGDERPATPPPPPAPPSDPQRLHHFAVAAFPYHDGPVLVPMLKPGLEFRLVPEPTNFSDPNAVRIEWRRDHLGYVPAHLAADIRTRLANGERLSCVASRVDPAAELPQVLSVDILLLPAEEEEKTPSDPMTAGGGEEPVEGFSPSGPA